MTTQQFENKDNELRNYHVKACELFEKANELFKDDFNSIMRNFNRIEKITEIIINERKQLQNDFCNENNISYLNWKM